MEVNNVFADVDEYDYYKIKRCLAPSSPHKVIITWSLIIAVISRTISCYCIISSADCVIQTQLNSNAASDIEVKYSVVDAVKYGHHCIIRIG